MWFEPIVLGFNYWGRPQHPEHLGHNCPIAWYYLCWGHFLRPAVTTCGLMLRPIWGRPQQVEAEFGSCALLALFHYFKYTIEGSGCNSRELLLFVTNHCERFTRPSLTVCKDTHIIAINSWLNQVLKRKDEERKRPYITISNHCKNNVDFNFLLVWEFFLTYLFLYCSVDVVFLQISYSLKTTQSKRPSRFICTIPPFQTSRK